MLASVSVRSRSHKSRAGVIPSTTQHTHHLMCTARFLFRSAILEIKYWLRMWYCIPAIHSTYFQLMSPMDLLKCTQETKEKDGNIGLSCISSSLRQRELPFIRQGLCLGGKPCTAWCLGPEFKRSAFASWPFIDYCLCITNIEAYKWSPKM